MIYDKKQEIIKLKINETEIETFEGQIKLGIEDLEDILSKMEKAILIVKRKKANFNDSQLQDIINKCKVPLMALQKVEKSSVTSFRHLAKSTASTNPDIKYQKKILDQWQSQMEEIVVLKGRDSRRGVCRTRRVVHRS